MAFDGLELPMARIKEKLLAGTIDDMNGEGPQSERDGFDIEDLRVRLHEVRKRRRELEEQTDE